MKPMTQVTEMTNTNPDAELKPQAITLPAAAGSANPMSIIDRAIAQGASMEVLEKLMGLQERWEKNQARKDFDEAIAAAKAEIPVIFKNRQVGFDNKSGGGRTSYRHEDLAEIARTIDPILSRHGLSYRWRTSSPPNEPVTVTCIVSHRSGHSEENTLSAGRDETGNKNAIQAIGSTCTFLQRYTLKAALGLAASNDDDAKSAGADAKTLSVDEISNLRTMMAAAGTTEASFLKWAKVEKIEDIQEGFYDSCVSAIMAASRAKKKTEK